MKDVGYLRMILGLRIVESLYMTEPGEPITVRRSWRERLFSRPWRPWRGTRIVVPQVPRRDGLILDDSSILMHPDTARLLRAALKEQA